MGYHPKNDGPSALIPAVSIVTRRQLTAAGIAMALASTILTHETDGDGGGHHSRAFAMASEHFRRCQPRAKGVLVRSRHLVAISVPGGSYRILAVCLLGRHRLEALTDGEDQIAYRPPAISANGYQLAYGEEDDFQNTSAAYIEVGDVRNTTGWRYDANPLQGMTGAGPEVASVRVGSDGDVAWISCTSYALTPQFGARTRDCVRPARTSRSSVFRASPHGRPVLLDSGREIKQLSLRLSGGTLSWVHSGRRRHARLP